MRFLLLIQSENWSGKSGKIWKIQGKVGNFILESSGRTLWIVGLENWEKIWKDSHFLGKLKSRAIRKKSLEKSGIHDDLYTLFRRNVSLLEKCAKIYMPEDLIKIVNHRYLQLTSSRSQECKISSLISR